MVIDTSAIFAAVVGEADSGVYRNAILSAPLRIISAVTLLETQIVLFSRSGHGSIVILHELILRAGIAIMPFDPLTAEAAFDAFKRYGKGRGHKAQLNIIDCAAYALAKTHDLPLLYKGADFAATDIEPALFLLL
ncbi:MAG: type II toxin-antitoxin system VapC family toxin [Hyphomicrobiales bacterium]|nr:type II toxin-antitoxin system VapC family toxin [Hyphomicrobiales bacterium]